MSALRLLTAMARPTALVAVLLFALLGGAFAGDATAVHPLLTVVPLVLAAWFANAVAVNDLADEAADRHNLPGDRGRPLVAGAVSRRRLAALAVGAAAVALAAAATIGAGAVAVVAGGLVLSAAYSLPPVRLAGRGAVAALLLPGGYVAVPYLVGSLAVDPHLTAAELAPLPGLWLVFLGRILLKDLRDEDGDRATGKRTYLVRHGRDATCTFASAAWVAGSAAMLVGVDGAGRLLLPVGILLAVALAAVHRLRAAGDGYEPLVGVVALAGRGLAVLLLAHLTPGVGAGALLALTAAVVAASVLLAPVRLPLKQGGANVRYLR